MKILNLTDDQASKLKMYLLMTTSYRNGEETACKELGTELNADGSLVYPNLKANGEWWEQTNKAIDEIGALLDA